ncbi:alpha/beta hydrolase [Minwuia sp.]|uniref:alpha/beta hydrolase family protein n=1 Tax=Minwuia sp. TaxID=2493630 RepID=UPI003A8E4D71
MSYWSDWDDEKIERHFNPRVAAPTAGDHLADFTERAAQTRQRYDMRRNISYGDHPREVYDLFPGVIGGPMHIFIHGGYWRALSKDEHSFVAPPFNAAGATVVMMNYPLCPEVTLGELVSATMRGIAHAAVRADSYGASPDRIHVSGHSAGAHLAAVAASRDWTGDKLPADLIRSATLLSGIFDPRVAMRTSINAEIGLDQSQAEQNNILTDRFRPLPHVEILLAAGGAEPDGWIRQSTDYREMFDVTRAVMLPEGANHFTLLDHVADPRADLCRAMLKLMA